MEKKRPWWQQPGIGIAIALVLLVLLGSAAGGIYYTQIPPEQPIQFPHNFHVGVGAQCASSHTGAATGPTAGLPTPEKCWGCHQQVQKQSLYQNRRQ